MSYFIIKYDILIDGKNKTSYHKNIENSKNKEVINVYTEHLTSYAIKAKKFYIKEEAYKIGELFKSHFQKPQIIEL